MMRRSVLQIVAVLVLFPAFFCVISFLVAEPRSELLMRGGDIPASWSAGVMNHGEYYRWWLPSDRPVFFLSSCFALILSLAYLFWSVLPKRR
jgi:hypothetical protein